MKLPTRTVRPPTHLLTLRVTEEEEELLRRASRGTPISTFIRTGALRVAHEILDENPPPTKTEPHVLDEFRHSEHAAVGIVQFLCRLAKEQPPSPVLRIESGKVYVNSTFLYREWIETGEKRPPTRTMIGRVLRKFTVEDDLPERRLVVDDNGRRVDFYNVDVIKMAKVADEIEPGLGAALEALVIPPLPSDVFVN